MSGWPVISLVLLGVAFVYLGVAGMTWRRRAIPGLAAHSWALVACSVYMAGFACELAPATARYTEWCENVVFLGGIPLAPLIVSVFADFTGHEHWLSRRTRFALFALPALDLAVKLTDRWHGVMHRTVTLEPHGSWNSVAVTPGPLFWVPNACLIIAAAFGAYAVVRTWPHASGVFRRQLATLALSMAVPAGAHVWRLSGRSPWGSLDLVPFALPPGMLILAWTMWRHRFARLAPIARNRVLALIRDAIVVADPQRRIADFNPAAAGLLGLRELDVTGEPLTVALAHWPQLVELCRSEDDRRREIAAPPPLESDWDADWRRLTDHGRHCGYLLNLREVTERKRAQRRLHELLTSRTRELRAATEAALRAGAEEQDRIGQELHDTICPELIGVVRQAELLADRPLAGEALSARLRELATLAGNASRRVRDLSHLLARPDLTHARFDDLLQAQSHRLEQTLGLTCELTVDRDFPALTPDASGHVLRIVREAVVNAARHAGARHVWIDCVLQEDGATISISNDGRPPSAEAQTDGLGFRQMRMRADLLEASVTLRPTATGAVLELRFASAAAPAPEPVISQP